ncbi:MAG: hypothetical protein K8R41_00780 [Bacteroidales bacterium]|nr:hypothetical protein [Bacteroidales bacterium]
MKDKDFYWGNSSPRKHSFCSIGTITSSGFQINTPIIFKNPSISNSKYSFHKSGQFHIKKLQNNKFSGAHSIENWGDKNDTKLVFRLISLPIEFYPVEKKNLIRNNSFGRSIMLKGDMLKNRLFAEFFLTKIPEHNRLNIPEFSIKIDKSKLIHHCLPVNSDYFLLVRFIVLTGLDSWHSDSEAVILPENEKIENI